MAVHLFPKTITPAELDRLRRLGYATQALVSGRWSVLELDRATGATTLVPVNVVG